MTPDESKTKAQLNDQIADRTWRAALTRCSAPAGVTGCNPDFNISQVGVITRWTPVKNLTFSPDLVWSHLDQKYSGAVALAPSGVTSKPAAVYELKDQDTITLLLRARRNW